MASKGDSGGFHSVFGNEDKEEAFDAYVAEREEGLGRKLTAQELVGIAAMLSKGAKDGRQ